MAIVEWILIVMCLWFMVAFFTHTNYIRIGGKNNRVRVVRYVRYEIDTANPADAPGTQRKV